MKNIEEMTLEEIEKVVFLTKEDLKKLTFAELCIYMENLNALKERYEKLKAESNN